MKTEKLKLSEIKPNKANPRIIRDNNFYKLVNSLLATPSMLQLRPIVTENDGTILGGNMRYKALESIARLDAVALASRIRKIKELKGDEALQNRMIDFWVKWCDNPTTYAIKATELSDAEKRAFIVKDNAGFGEWDYDALANEFDAEELSEWCVDIPNLDSEEETEIEEKEARPFDESVLVLVYNPNVHSEVMAAIEPIREIVEIKSQMV